MSNYLKVKVINIQGILIDKQSLSTNINNFNQSGGYIDPNYQPQKTDYADIYMHYHVEYQREPTQQEINDHIDKVVNLRRKYGRYIIYGIDRNKNPMPVDLKFLSSAVLYFLPRATPVPISAAEYNRLTKKSKSKKKKSKSKKR